MSRGWTFLDNIDISEEEIEKRTPLLDALAKQWSNLHDGEERRRFAREADLEDGYDDREYDEENEEAERYLDVHLARLRADQHYAEIRAIENLMAEQGARMMRPYEHWNEDEAYIQYMEERSDY
jgi:hypothetical protein